ncbi:MAG: CRISPR-associated protein Cas4 [Verrucomicrobia bacterium]|nr:CRISPR-associated protein Cas4 [Verrucomicrobiota bacterium]
MFAEEDLLPISALQHLAFCRRQCALIHVEQVWSENRLTAEGRLMHERVHGGGGESRGALRIARGQRLRSLRLGLTGVADVVEFRRPIESAAGSVWMPFPVEYKRGKPKSGDCDSVQLCAQALCLEEMLGVDVPAGALYYGLSKRRHDVFFDAALRETTARAAHDLHALVVSGITPPPVYEEKCKRCSLLALCMPEVAGSKSARQYMEQIRSDDHGA